jgi:hypothetical protein
MPIEKLTQVPRGVIGFRVWGRLSGDDLRGFKPDLDELRTSGEIRIVEVIEPDYAGLTAGGVAEDLKMGLGLMLEHHSAFKRIAIVSDKEWIGHAVHAMAWMVPGELAVFGRDHLEQAIEWAAGD